jgi:hypothetical protein
MPKGEAQPFIALLVLSALLLSVLGVRGFGQALLARIADGVLAAGFLAAAIVLIIMRPAPPRLLYAVLLVPLLAAAFAWQARGRARARRSAAGFTPQPYAGEPAAVPPQPFPAAPPPLGTPGRPLPDESALWPGGKPPPAGRGRGPMPSGLPGASTASAAEIADRHPPRPSGLPGTGAPGPDATPNTHAEPSPRHASPEPTRPGRHARPDGGQ